MYLPITIIWVSPLSVLEASGVFLIFYSILNEKPLSKRNSPRWDATFLRCHIWGDRYCVPMSHKKDTRLKCYICTSVNVIRQDLKQSNGFNVHQTNLNVQNGSSDLGSHCVVWWYSIFLLNLRMIATNLKKIIYFFF